MVFLATKLRRLPEAENPTLVIVTDRTDLDDQITSQFKRSGFPNPIQAESGEALRRASRIRARALPPASRHRWSSP